MCTGRKGRRRWLVDPTAAGWLFPSLRALGPVKVNIGRKKVRIMDSTFRHCPRLNGRRLNPTDDGGKSLEELLLHTCFWRIAFRAFDWLNARLWYSSRVA